MNNSESKKAHNKKVKTTKLSELGEPVKKPLITQDGQDEEDLKDESISAMLTPSGGPTKIQPKTPSDLTYMKVSSNGSKK
jgi:hypothetical protein